MKQVSDKTDKIEKFIETEIEEIRNFFDELK